MKKTIKAWIIICWIKTIRWSIERWFNVGFDGIWISGHSFVEQKDGSLKCEICGKISK